MSGVPCGIRYESLTHFLSVEENGQAETFILLLVDLYLFCKIPFIHSPDQIGEMFRYV